MSEIAARTLATSPSARPGVVRTLAWVGLAGGAAGILASFALYAPTVAGVATPDVSGSRAAFFPNESLGAVLANGCILLTYVWAWTLLTRGVFRLGGGREERLAYIPIALTLAPAVLLAASTSVPAPAAGVIAALCLRYTAFRADDGTPLPEPFAPVSRRVRAILPFALPLLAVGGATAFAMYHPLHVRWWSGPDAQLKPSRADLHLLNPIIENSGGRPMEILAIEPGVEQGYALHLTGVNVMYRGATNGIESPYRPFHPFTLAPHATRDDLVMVVSRAGCRPGISGAIESVRVRYRLGGERTTLLRLEEPLRLDC